MIIIQHTFYIIKLFIPGLRQCHATENDRIRHGRHGSASRVETYVKFNKYLAKRGHASAPSRPQVPSTYYCCYYYFDLFNNAPCRPRLTACYDTISITPLVDSCSQHLPRILLAVQYCFRQVRILLQCPRSRVIRRFAVPYAQQRAKTCRTKSLQVRRRPIVHRIYRSHEISA